MAKKEKKFNLYIVDRQVEIDEFRYCGLSEDDKNAVYKDMRSQDCDTISFHYDEGEAVIFKECIHSLVFSDYVPLEDLDNPSTEEE